MTKVLSRAKRYAAKQFDMALQNEEVERHHINNATKIVGYLMKAAEQEDKAPELGVVLAELRKSGDPIASDL
jgi:hypothetical protein